MYCGTTTPVGISIGNQIVFRHIRAQSRCKKSGQFTGTVSRVGLCIGRSTAGRHHQRRLRWPVSCRIPISRMGRFPGEDLATTTVRRERYSFATLAHRWGERMLTGQARPDPHSLTLARLCTTNVLRNFCRYRQCDRALGSHAVGQRARTRQTRASAHQQCTRTTRIVDRP